MSLSPIALFVYKRLQLTKLTVEALLNNPEAADSDLIVFSDAAKTDTDSKPVSEVRDYLKTITGFKSVTINESPVNKGLANSIMGGVTEVVNKYGKIIVVEDDLVVSPYFLKYMNSALDIYENEPDVVSIHGYVYPVDGILPETFFIKGADCWGWGTWKRGWSIFNPDSAFLYNELIKRNLGNEFDLDGNARYMRMLRNQINGKIDSWAIRWHASAFLAGKYTLYPGRSLVKNIGMGKDATHTKSANEFLVDMSASPVNLVPQKVEENLSARALFSKFYKDSRPGLLNRVLIKIGLK
jgi:hypothetical protein